MKRIIVTILAIAYLGTSTGAVISMHFCMGKLANWSFGNDETKTCGKCGMEKKSNHGCCQDQHKFFKSSSDQKITESAFNQIQLLAAVLPAPFFEVKDVVLPRITEENSTGHAPPLGIGVAVYLRNCVFLI